MTDKTTVLMRSALAAFRVRSRASYKGGEISRKYLFVDPIDLEAETKPLPPCCRETRVVGQRIDSQMEEVIGGDVAE